MRNDYSSSSVDGAYGYARAYSDEPMRESASDYDDEPVECGNCSYIGFIENWNEDPETGEYSCPECGFILEE